jgi:Pvc16 N-terminal domain
MINDVLAKIRDKLNDYFKVITSSDTSQVTFLDGLKMDPLSFPPNSVVPVLINVEEEKIIRQANRYEGVVKNGIKTELSPSIGINIMVLFVFNFSDYEQSLQFLSLIISYFQRFPVLDHSNTPTLPDALDKVVVELVTFPIAQQNELWNSLKTTYRPSVIYKIGVLVYRDNTSVRMANEVSSLEIKTNLQ